jgi:hypothetical protein
MNTLRGFTLLGVAALTLALVGGTASGQTVVRPGLVVTRQLPDRHVVYMLLVAPQRDFAALEPTFDRMVRSLRTDTRAVHG